MGIIGSTLTGALVISLCGASRISSEYTVSVREDKELDSLVIDGVLAGRAVRMNVYLSADENYIGESLANELGATGDSLSAPIKLGQQQLADVSFKIVKGGRSAMILGRRVFEDRFIKWDIVNSKLTISQAGPLKGGGFDIDKETGQFKVFDRNYALPAISKDTLLWSGSQVPDSFELGNAFKLRDRPAYGIPIVGSLLGQIQTFTGRDRLLNPSTDFGRKFSLGVPGASFFGAQTVEIDFKHSKIYFDADPIHRGAYIMAYRLGLSLIVQDGHLVLVGSSSGPDDLESLRSMGIIGFHVESFGNVKLETSHLGDIVKIREFLLAIEKEKFMRLSDGEKTFTLRFE